MGRPKKYFTEEERCTWYRAQCLVSNYNRMDKLCNREKGNLTPKWVIENIFNKPCAHCDKTGWDVIGCNRLDNNKPHTMDNVEPCCKECNDRLAHKYFTNGFLSKKVGQYDKSGNLINIWPSACEAGRNGYTKQNIIACCNKRPHHNTHKGFIWKWIEM